MDGDWCFCSLQLSFPLRRNILQCEKLLFFQLSLYISSASSSYKAHPQCSFFKVILLPSVLSPLKFPFTVSSSAQCQHELTDTVIITPLLPSPGVTSQTSHLSSTQQRPSEEHSFLSNTQVTNWIFGCWPFVNRSKCLWEIIQLKTVVGIEKKKMEIISRGRERVVVYQPLQQKTCSDIAQKQNYCWQQRYTVCMDIGSKVFFL